jgi:hypothetical protein
MRIAMDRAGRSGGCIVTASVKTVFTHDDAAMVQRRGLAAPLGLGPPPRPHPIKLSGANPPDRMDSEIELRTEVISLFLNEANFLRVVGAILLKKMTGGPSSMPATLPWKASLRSAMIPLSTLPTLSDRSGRLCRRSW